MRDIFFHNRIYFVTCEEFSEGRSDERMAELVLSGGVRVLQLRDKHSSRPVLLRKAQRLREITREYQAVLIINDDPELALEVGADGVHLGQGDLPVGEARRLRYRDRDRDRDRRGEDLIIGLSTHNLEEVRGAEGPDYINLGPVFSTPTKPNAIPLVTGGFDETPDGDPSRYQLLKDMIAAAAIPFTVMGGIQEKHILPLSALGVRHFAMVSELSRHPHPDQHAAALIALARSGEMRIEEKAVI